MNSSILRSVFLLFSLTLLLSGCASPSANGPLTLKVTQVNVDWKMIAYQRAADSGNLTFGQRQDVSSAYKAFQAAFQQALTAAGGNLKAPSPPDLQNQATQLVSLIDSVLATVP